MITNQFLKTWLLLVSIINFKEILIFLILRRSRINEVRLENLCLAPSTRLKLLGGWRSAGRMEGVRNVLKVSELNHSIKERAYKESLRGKYEVWRGGEKEWEKLRVYQ